MLSRLERKVCQQQLAISRTVLFSVLLRLLCMGVKRDPALKEKHELQTKYSEKYHICEDLRH